MATVKKTQASSKQGPGPKKPTVMQKLKMKYPDADTTAKGDVRGTEMNAYAPKKVVQQYSDTYDAFQKKFGNKPAKDKKGGVVKKASMKTGGTLSPSKKSIGKTIGKLNKAKSGSKLSKKK